MLTRRQVIDALQSGRAPLSAEADAGDAYAARAVVRLDRVLHALQRGEVPLSKPQRAALRRVLDAAIENSCSCVECDAGIPVPGIGRHARDCWVYMMRRELRIVLRILGGDT